MHEIVYQIKAGELRAKFIKAFVDTSTDYFKKNIENVKPTDIQYDTYSCAYLRDTLYWNTSTVITFNSAIQIISEKKRVYSMWDIQATPIFTDPDILFLKPHYLDLYKSDTIIEWDTDELAALLQKELGDYDSTDCEQNTLPEDIYVFDDSFEWNVIFTHSPTKSPEMINGVRQREERLCFSCSRHVTREK